MTLIHPTAIIDSAAELHESVTVGPYTVIGPHVRIESGTTVGPHCIIEGRTTIGRDNRIFQFNSLGAIPQDKKYAGEPCELHIGDRNTIREFCTFNIGSPGDAGVTQLGNDNWIMAYVHIAHDCQVGDNTIFANGATLGGHVHVGDWVFLGGLSGVHQFVRIGAHAMTGFQTRLAQDLPPYVTVAGNPAAVAGINQEGLRRRGFTPERITVIKQLHRVLYRQRLTLEAAKAEMARLLEQEPASAVDVQPMLDFLALSDRGIVR
jgi:UDP-N-acetylglucosamine acyltransferase